jgi:hypothetical protein
MVGLLFNIFLILLTFLIRKLLSFFVTDVDRSYSKSIVTSSVIPERWKETSVKNPGIKSLFLSLLKKLGRCKQRKALDTISFHFDSSCCPLPCPFPFLDK